MGSTVAPVSFNVTPIIFIERERRDENSMKKRSAEIDKANFCKNAKKLAKRCERIRHDQSVGQYFYGHYDLDEPDMMARNYDYNPQKVGRSIMIGLNECQTLAQKLNDYCEKHGLETRDPKEIISVVSEDPAASMEAIAKIEKEESQIISIPTFFQYITKKTP